MSTPTLIKQPAESRLYTMDFTPLLSEGIVLASVVSVAQAHDADADPLVINAPTFVGPHATTRVSGGESGNKYKLTFLVTDSAGNTLESEGYLQVVNL